MPNISGDIDHNYFHPITYRNQFTLRLQISFPGVRWILTITLLPMDMYRFQK